MTDRNCKTPGCERLAQPRSDVCHPCIKRARRVSKRPAVDRLPGEEWRDIPGYEGLYQASSLGRISRLLPEGRPPVLRKLTAAPLGYFKVSLTDRNSKTRLFLAHRVTALTFYGPCPDGMEVRHLNGMPGDNRVENLRYGTSSENKYDTVRLGRHWLRRKTHCKYGHEFTVENTSWVDGGAHRRCLTCHRGGPIKPTPPRINLGQTCSRGGCEKPAHARGLCGAHYQRLIYKPHPRVRV